MNLRVIKYFFLAAIVLVTASCSLAGQLKKANKKYDIGEYYAAAPLLKRVYSRVDSKDKQKRGEIMAKVANCYRLVNDNTRAEMSYATVLKTYVPDSTVYLNYALVLLKNEKTREARSNFEKYLRYDPNNAEALNGVVSCDSIKSWRKIPTQYSVKIESAINSTKGDFCPSVGDSDGSVLYFTSTRSNAATGSKNSAITGVRNNDIFVIRKNQSGKWETAKALDDNVNTVFDEGAQTISTDGKTMFFTRARSLPTASLGTEIYSMQHSGGEWTAPQKITLVQDSSITVAHPALSPDGKYLYFVSDMLGGMGGKDIWRAEQQDSGEWGAPENLRAPVNTPGDEMFPSFRADGTLYFSSNGHPGFGGLDIYSAKYVKSKDSKEGTWEVENMFTPINSNGDDFGITFIGKQNKGYFSSNRKEPKGYDRIYSFEVPTLEFAVKGKVLDTNEEPVSDAIVRIVGDDGTNAKIRVKKDGSYSYKLDKEVKYIMQASARGYLNEKGELSTIGVKKTQNYTTDFHLPSLGKPVKMDNVLYETGKYELTKASEEVLRNTLLKNLQDNPNITIEISAHTDMVGSEESNMILSQKRAEAVVNFLIKSGIEADRLTAKGYGETQPIVADEALIQKYNFLRDGEVLNEELVSKLNAKQQEIVNSLNRRTEFKVLKTTYKLY